MIHPTFVSFGGWQSTNMTVYEKNVLLVVETTFFDFHIIVVISRFQPQYKI